jgi:hypothetical protein
MTADFNTVATEVGALVTVKNAAYGDSFAKCGQFLALLYPGGIQPAQYDDALAMVRIFDKQMRVATRKDAFGESPYRDIAGYGILGATKDERFTRCHTPLPPEEVERISGEVAKTPPICVSCASDAAKCEHSGETVKWCGWYTSSLRERIAEAKGTAISEIDIGLVVMAEAKEPQALDLSLPSIMLECTAEEAHRKYAEENAEWLTTDIGTMEELIERWDCLQALNTYLDRGGDAAFVMDEINYITHDLKAYAAKGAKLMEAKAAAILKNAKRGYYSPEVNQIIIASNGERWK